MIAVRPIGKLIPNSAFKRVQILFGLLPVRLFGSFEVVHRTDSPCWDSRIQINNIISKFSWERANCSIQALSLILIHNLWAAIIETERLLNSDRLRKVNKNSLKLKSRSSEVVSIWNFQIIRVKFENFHFDLNQNESKFWKIRISRKKLL